MAKQFTAGNPVTGYWQQLNAINERELWLVKQESFNISTK